jgi:kinetochore protein Mis12/MTW1
MASSSACTALLTEHLRCTPLTIIDDIINTTNELLYHSVAAVETYLLTSAPSSLGFAPPPGTIRDTNSDGTELYSDAETEELEKGVHSLETLLESAVDRSFDRFEIYVLRNILTVPEDLVPWVRLAHHKVFPHPPPRAHRRCNRRTGADTGERK